MRRGSRRAAPPRLAPCERIVIFADNSPETVAAIFAVLEAGGVFSVVNPSTKLDKLAYILDNCGARGLLTEPKLLPLAAKAARSAPSVAFTLVSPFADEGISSEKEEARQQPGIDLDLAMIVYTSGPRVCRKA